MEREISMKSVKIALIGVGALGVKLTHFPGILILTWPDS